MLKIRKIKIRNFKSIKNLDLILQSSKQLIIGQNNTGKSNILSAIDAVFNYRYIASETDVYNQRAEDQETYIDIMLTEESKDKSFSEIWYTIFDPNHIIKNEFDEDSYSIRCVIKDNPSTKRYEIKRFPISKWESTQFEPDTTLKNEFRKIVQTYYIKANRNIVDELRLRSSNFSKLLKDSNFNISDNDKQEIEVMLNKVNALIANKMPDLKAIESNLSKITTTLSNIEEINILPIPNKLDDLDKGAEILVKEHEDKMPISIYGDGTKSWMSILSLKTYIDLQAKDNKLEGLPFFPILLIEEPEAHLHPHAQNKLLKQLSTTNSHILTTSHSSNVLSQSEGFEIIKISKKAGKTNVSSLFNKEISSKFKYKLKNFYIPYHTEVLFSNLTIITEGMSDKFFIEKYLAYKLNKSVYDVGISVVDAKGYSGASEFRRFCDLFEIENVIFVDSDEASSVIKQLDKNHISKDKLFCTKFDDLEDDIVEENYDLMKNMFFIENEVKDKDKFSEHNDVKQSVINYFKNNKNEYPHIISNYFKKEFNVESINNVIDFIGGKIK